MFLKIFFVTCMQINFVYNCDGSVSDVTDTSGISEEYLNIFRTIPTLFEYVMNVIEEKPEILEKDDISVFTMDSSKYFDEISNKDSSILADEHDGEIKEIADMDNSDSGDEYDSNSSEEDEDDNSSKEDVYVDSDSTEYLDKSKDDYDDDDDDDDDDDNDDDDDDDDDDDVDFGDFWRWFAAAVASERSSLTSTEIAEKTLEIEKQLEEYNNNNKDNKS